LRPEATTKRRGSRGCLLRLSDLPRHGWSMRRRRMGSRATPARAAREVQSTGGALLSGELERGAVAAQPSLSSNRRGPPSSPCPRASPPSLSQALRRAEDREANRPTGSGDRPGHELPSLLGQPSSSSPRTGGFSLAARRRRGSGDRPPLPCASCGGRTRWRPLRDLHRVRRGGSSDSASGRPRSRRRRRRRAARVMPRRAVWSEAF
jgi:hypothetical protein